MAGGGVVGAGAARREGEWLRAYGRAAAMVPRVEALAAGRARLEAVNALQHESWEARDDRLQWRLLKADENMRMWEATCMAQQPSGDGRLFAELLKSENEDLEDFIQVLELENEELKIRVKEVEGGAGHCQNAAGHEHIAGDLEAALRQLNQVHEALIAEKDKEISALIAEKDNEISALIAEKDKEISALIAEKDNEISALIAEKDKEFSALIAEKDLVREQFMTLERDYADLHSYSSKQEAQVTEAKQELEQLQVAFQKKDDEIRKPRARAKAAEAKRKLVPEGKRQEMTCMPKETDGQIEKCKYRQPETSEKCKKDTSETHTKNCSQRPALRGEEMKICSSKQMLVKDGQPQTSLKRKCVTSLPKDNAQNANDVEKSNQVLEPLKKKRVPEKGEQDDSKVKLANGKSNRYRDVGKAVNGEDFNPSQHPIDPDLVMLAGDGRPHGHIAIGDGLIRSSRTFREIKATSSCPEMPPRPKPLQLAIQAALQKERETTQALLAEKKRESEERTARLLEEERARNDATTRAMYELIVSMYEKSGQAPPPMPVIATAATNNSRAASHNPGPGGSAPGVTGPMNPDASPPC